MRILGCDYSTHYVDFVTIEDGRPPCWDRFPLHGNDSFERARSVAGNIPGRAYAYWDDVLAVGIEEPAGRNTGHMFRVQGALLACIPDRMLVEKWMPSAWRKAVGLSGNSSKDEVASWVLGHTSVGAVLNVDPPTMFMEGHLEGTPATPLHIWPQDACDAYCLAVATARAVTEQDAA